MQVVEVNETVCWMSNSELVCNEVCMTTSQLVDMKQSANYVHKCTYHRAIFQEELTKRSQLALNACHPRMNCFFWRFNQNYYCFNFFTININVQCSNKISVNQKKTRMKKKWMQYTKIKMYNISYECQMVSKETKRFTFEKWRVEKKRWKELRDEQWKRYINENIIIEMLSTA